MVQGDSIGFEKRSRQARLPDNSRQRAHSQFGVVWHRHGDGRILFFFLHDNVASFPANLVKALLSQDFADFSTGKDAQSGHVQLASFRGSSDGTVGMMAMT
jgi:hypothetical protein